MRNVWHWFGTVLLVLAGCRSTGPNLKPEEQPECYTLPSESDKRYSDPYKYPKDPDEPSLSPSHKNGGGGAGPGAPGGPTRGAPRAGMGPGGY
jgi:hypothetical protein